MKVRLHEIPCHQSVELSNELVRSAVSGLSIRAALERPADDPEAGRGQSELDLYIEGQSVFARGSVEGWVEVACSRCVGTWAAAGLATTQVLAPRFGRLLTWSLAAAGANDFLQAGFAALTRDG